MRASSRPKKSSTNRRATCVESTRSVAAWNVPTFSAREWRSAADDALGANGSWTCTKSNGAVSRTDSIVRETSIGTDTLPPRRLEHALADGQHARAAVVREDRLGVARAHRLIAARDSRTSWRDSEGAITTTRWPRRAQLVGQPLDEAVDLVVLLPGVRRYLGDGERLRRHRLPPEATPFP